MASNQTFHDMGFKALSTTAFELVGAPCGVDVSLLDKKLAGVRAKLDQFRALPSAHLGFLLARHCGAYPLLAYWVRLVGHDGARQWREADDATIQYVSSLLGKLTPEATTLIHLPASHGGLGLKQCGGIMCEIASFASHQESFQGVQLLAKHEADNPESACLAEARKRMVELGFDITKLPASKIQKFLSGQWFDAQLQQMMERTDLPTRTKNILVGARNSLGNHWLTPNFDLVSVVELPTASFLAWGRFRLGLPLAAEPRACTSNCGVMCDVFGDHTLSCMKGGEKQRWHALLEKEIARLASLALWHPQREVHPFPEHPTRRLDVVLPQGTARTNHQLLIDVAITNGGMSARAVPKHSGDAAHSVAINDKQKLYGPMLDATSQLLLPLVFETLGATTDEGAKFIKQLARAVLTRLEVPGGLAYVPTHVGSTITRCVANRLAKQFAQVVTSRGPSVHSETAGCTDSDGDSTDGEQHPRPTTAHARASSGDQARPSVVFTPPPTPPTL